MAILWHDGFDHYGTDIANMTSGQWASVSANVSISAPSYLARTGPYALGMGFSSTARRILGGSHATVIVGFAFSTTALPSAEVANMFSIRDVANTAIVNFSISPQGAFRLLTAAGVDFPVTLAVSANGVITASTWHYIEIKMGVAAKTVTVRVDGETVITYSGGAWAQNAAESIQFSAIISGMSIDDLVVRDGTGTRNNDFEGDLRVATLFPNNDEADQGWTPQPRKKFGLGILDNTATNACVSAADAAAMELGSGSFTIEGWWRPQVLPTAGNKSVLIGKWQESGDQRSWQLYWDFDTASMVFKVSTSGAAGTVVTIHNWPVALDLYKWYHIAVVRDGTDNMLFVNGVQQGIPVADANTYFDGAATLVLCGEMSSGSDVVASRSFDSFLEEVRITVGVARYTSDFAVPSAAFGRSVGADPDFNSVVLLAGFDSGITDESSYARTLTARNSAVRFAIDDGNFAYETIDQANPRDDTYIEARLIAATGIYQLDVNATNNETVVLGAKTYTFKTVLTPAANEVLIGANVAASLSNLVAAITAGAGEGTLYGTGTTANADATAALLPAAQILATALAPGTAGNTITSTETTANGAWLQGATLEGGEDIPGHSEFGFQALPATATVVRSMSIVHRGYKSDAGTAKIQVSMVDALDAVELGAERTLTTNPIFREEVFDEDPTTGGGLTPTFIDSVKVRVDRTE